MHTRTVLHWTAAILVATVCLAPSNGFAEDMAKVAPKFVKVLLDNEHVRVLEVNAKAGDKIPMHSHPGYFVYSFTNGKSKDIFPDGKTAEREFKMGETVWGKTHAHANEAITDVHVLVTELKEQKGMKK